MIQANEKLGLKLLPSKGRLIADLTILNRGLYWIHGPVLEKIEELLEEKITLSEISKSLYKDICTVIITFSSNLYYFTFNTYPSRPWFMTNIYDYHRWLAMVDGYDSSRTIFFTKHKFMAVSAITFLKKFGYAIDIKCKKKLFPENSEQMEVEFGELAVELREHQKESVEKAVERNYKLVIGDPPGLGKCLKGDTLVILADGNIKEIKDLYDEYNYNTVHKNESEEIIDLETIKVVSFDGEKMIAKEARHLYRQKINAPLISIKTASGKKITSTLNHKFYTFDPNGYGVWKKAVNITKDDYIAILAKLPLDNHTHISLDFSNNFIDKVDDKIRIKKNDSIHNTHQVPIRCPEVFTDDFFEFMGWLLAEGCEGDYSHVQRISLCQHDDDILDRFGELFRITFGIEPKIDKKNHEVHINSISAVEFLKSIGYEFGYKAINKHFPKWIVSAPLELMNVCLRSFFDGDGSMMKNGTIEVSSASRLLIHQIYYMLLRNEIVSTYSEAQKGLKLGLTNLHYTLRIMSIGDLKKFHERIGFSLERKQVRLEEYIETTNAGQRYHYGLPFSPKLMKSIRDTLGLYQHQMGVSLATVGHLEDNETRNIGRRDLIKIVEKCAQRCCDFDKWILNIPSIDNWDAMIQCISELNIKKTKICNILGTSVNNVNYVIKKQLTDQLFFDIKEVVMRLCQEAIDLKLVLENIYFNISTFCFDNIIDIKISDSQEQYVYDLYVPETNNFVAGNGILCHNTITCGAILHQLSKSGKIKRILWVVPNSSLTEQVRGEMLDKFNTEVFSLTGETRKRQERLGLRKDENGREVQVQATEYERHGFICTNWNLFSKDFTPNKKKKLFTNKVTFDAIVFDEAHRCKDGNLAYDAALAITAPVRIALSGTVMPNGKWEELFDMLNVIDPPSAPSKKYFKDTYYTYFKKFKKQFDERTAEVEATKRVNKIALKYMIDKISIHNKEDVIEDLPKLIESRIHTPFSKVDKQVFDFFKEIIFGIIDEIKNYPSVWEMSDFMKKKFYSLRAAMIMVYQDLRRFCAFGASVLRNRIKEYSSNKKYAYKLLRELFLPTIRELKRLASQARESPKNAKIINFINNTASVKKCVIFCTEIEPNKKMVFDLVKKGIAAKVIMGKSNSLTEEEAQRLDQHKRFRDRDVDEILAWFWMPWSALSEFLRKRRNEEKLLSVVTSEGETIQNFFYTSLAMAFPKKKDSFITIKLVDLNNTEMLIDTINRDGFYKAVVNEENNEIVLTFRKDQKKVLVTTDKLQEGINLQDANTMIFYDYPFSIREREQRMSRVWRDGSRHKQITVLYVMNGIEYKIEKKLKEKYSSTSILGFADPSPISMKDLFSIL